MHFEHRTKPQKQAKFQSTVTFVDSDSESHLLIIFYIKFAFPLSVYLQVSLLSAVLQLLCYLSLLEATRYNSSLRLFYGFDSNM